MLPEFACGAPSHVPFRNQSTVTFPVGGLAGSGFGDETCTKSCTCVPATTTVPGAWPPLWMVVAPCDGRGCSVTVAGAVAWLIAFGLQLDPPPCVHFQEKSSWSLSW